MSAEVNKALYRRFVEEVINEGNVDLVDDLFSPDYVDHNLPPGAPPGLEAIRTVPALFRGGFPDVHFTIESMVADGDRAATRVAGRGTHNGPFLGVAPTGRQDAWSSIGIFRVATGKIVEHWGYPDLASLLQQIGAAPEPGSR